MDYKEKKKLKERFLRLSKELENLNTSISIDNISKMVGLVNNSPCLLISTIPKIILDRNSGLLIQSSDNLKATKDFTSLINKCKNNSLGTHKLIWELMNPTELKSLLQSSAGGEIKKAFNINKYIYCNASKRTNGLDGHTSLAHSGFLSNSFLGNISKQMPFYFNKLYDISNNRLEEQNIIDSVVVLFKHKFRFNEKVKELKNNYNEESASKYLFWLAEDGFNICNQNILETAHLYYKKLQISEELNAIEAEFKKSKTSLPVRGKLKSVKKESPIKVSPEDTDVFAYRSEISGLIQESISELRSFTTENSVTIAGIVNEVKLLFQKLNFHNTNDDEKRAIKTAIDSELALLEYSPESLIVQLISFEQEIESLTNESSKVAFAGEGNTKLKAILKSQLLTLDNASNFIENSKSEYITQCEIIMDNSEDLINLFKQQVEHIIEFGNFLDTGRRKFHTVAIKEQTEINITNRLWDMQRELRVQSIVSYSELFIVALRGKFELDKMPEVFAAVKSFEEILENLFTKMLHNKELNLVSLPKETDTALQKEYAKLRKKLHSIKYEF